jgi:hypothetical protein
MSFLEKVKLPKSSKKLPCPGCRKRTFKPYVWADTEIAIDETVYGRCDRQNECTYDMKPAPEIIKAYTGEGKKSTMVATIIYPNEAEILKTLHRTPSNLHLFLEKKGIPIEYLYNEGVLTTDSGLTAYVFRDHAGKLCNVKYFKYKENGKREHSFNAFSLKQPEQRNQYIEEKYTMPSFGENDLDPTSRKTVCVVESEKTKVIAKFHYPEYDWAGCGSANGLSDGTDNSADKITPLKGRNVFWLCDADKASRGKMMVMEKTGKEEWVWCSSVRNGIKHIENFSVVDLWPEREDGYDIGDAILDGLKPEIKPTWSKKHQDKRYKSYIPPTIETEHNRKPVQVGETSGINLEFDNTFSCMRTHVNAFYGWSNDGKGVMCDFLSVAKSKKSGWKRCVFKQEDMGSYFDGKNAKINADKIYDKLVWTYTGQPPPSFELYAKKHNIQTLSWDKYHTAMEWVKKHQFVVYPEDRRYKNVFDEFLYFHEVFGVDVFEIDPWNTIILDDKIERGDERLIKAFIYAKEFALRTNTMLNIVNHAGSKHEVKEKGGAFKVVTQFMQLGGSGWDIKMDGQFSVHRPFRHKNPNDPVVHLYNLKQRDSESTGAERGVYKKIEFDKHRRQYYFDGVCPIDGTLKTPVQQTLDEGYTPSWKRNKKKKEDKDFDTHISQDWAQPDSDIPPF